MPNETEEGRARRAAKSPGADWWIQARTNEGNLEIAGQGVFDELIVDHWLHIEQMDPRSWGMRVGNVRIEVFIEEDGAVAVRMEDGFYDCVRQISVDESEN